MREGERLIKNVYEALRNSSRWNDTLLVINFDEHGGFFDHVAPPQDGVPNPDGLMNHYGFNFTRLGVRLPFLLVSPWINKNTLIHEPKEH
jgi:phospholipase C